MAIGLMDKKLNCILLVDDDYATNELHKLVIQVAGAAETVHVATNGQEALDYLTTAVPGKEGEGSFPQPDLILLDINMPRMDGFEFMEAYSKLPQSQKAQIIVVMLTTSLSKTDKETADQYEDIRDYLHKPLTVELLEQVIEQHF